MNLSPARWEIYAELTGAKTGAPFIWQYLNRHAFAWWRLSEPDRQKMAAWEREPWRDNQEAVFHMNYGRYIARHMFVWAGLLPHEDKQKLLKWERQAYDAYSHTRNFEGFYRTTPPSAGFIARTRTIMGRYNVPDGMDVPGVQAPVLQAPGRDT